LVADGRAYVSSKVESALSEYVTDLGWSADLKLGGLAIHMAPTDFGGIAGQVGGSIVDAVFDAGIGALKGRVGKMQSDIANVARRPVEPGDRASYGDLKAQKRKYGETEPLHMDHQPSLAATVAEKERLLGRQLTAEEYRKVRDSAPAVGSPVDIHTGTSPTYGGRNSAERIYEDSLDLSAAEKRDRKTFNKAMKQRGKP
jgi:hypothetical protein